MKSDITKKLKKYGYGRQAKPIREKDNNTYCKKNFKEQILNQSFMERVSIEKCNFDLASVTGSIYRDCDFINNSFQESDFEFCEFQNCKFWNKDKIVTSFNGSNFLHTDFYDIVFDACTFTSAYFEDCHFWGGEIKLSTLENSIFRNCFFKDMDISFLNMDYVELIQPHMENVTLSVSQIPFMFGCIQYLRTTKDSVKIEGNKKRFLTPEEYFSDVIPLLIQYFSETEQYFPLANIYLSLESYDDAIKALKKGISISAGARDFRMLKYYCYLIAKSGCFKADVLHMFYNNICRLSPQGQNMLNEQRNYTRHIGEIKSILFGTNPIPTLKFTLRTNILSRCVDKVSKVFEMLFAVSKKDIGCGKNQVGMFITENSPLLIEVTVNGEETALMALLSAITQLAETENEMSTLLPDLDTGKANMEELNSLVTSYRSQIKDLSVSLFLVEYYFENFTEYSFENKPCYYYNSLEMNRLYTSSYAIGENAHG